MKRVSLILFIMLLSFGKSSAQTYYHDDAVMMQFMMGEVGGAPSAVAQWYYDAFHNSYQKTAIYEPKLAFRALELEAIVQQTPFAEEIDSMFVKRAEVEALNLADREIDLAWQTEQFKIQGKFDEIDKALMEVMPSGGSSAEKEIYVEKFNCLKCGLETIKEEYLPNSERKQQYLEIYKDSQKLLNVINLSIYFNKTKKGRMIYKNGQFTHKLNLGVIAASARERFLNIVTNKRGSGSGGSSGGGVAIE